MNIKKKIYIFIGTHEHTHGILLKLFFYSVDAECARERERDSEKGINERQIKTLHLRWI